MACDVVVGCIGFERSNTLCEWLTGRKEVKTTNYLDQHMMYLADAEIDEGRCFRIQMYSVVRCLFFLKMLIILRPFLKASSGLLPLLQCLGLRSVVALKIMTLDQWPCNGHAGFNEIFYPMWRGLTLACPPKNKLFVHQDSAMGP